MTHEVKPLKTTFTRFLLCSIFYRFFLVVATFCFWALLNALAVRRYIQVQLHTPTEAYLGCNECIGF